MTVARIFVSYEPTDAAFATQLMTDLRKTGAEVITDTIGLEDTAFEQFLSEKLPQCQQLIVVQTPAALQSPRVRARVVRALKQVQEGQMTAVVRVIAPALNGAKGQAVPLRWASMPEFDASQDYPRALARLCLHLGIGSNEVPHAPPPSAASMPPLGLPDSKGTRNKPLFAAPFHAQRSAAKDRPLRPHGSPHWPLPRRLFFLSLAMALVLVVTSVMVFIHQRSVSPPPTGSTPVVTPTSISFTNLDDQASQWTINPDQAGETLTNVQYPTDVASPSADGSALQASFTSDGILVYRKLPPADNVKTFELNLSFYLPAGAPIPALGFALGKLVNGQWWEWGLQWLNNSSGASWSVWDGSSNAWQDTHAMQILSGNTWHNLQLKGDIVNGQVHYISFSCDEVSQNLGQTFASASRSSDNQLAIFLELDGAQGNPYQVYIDRVNLLWS